MSEEQLPGTGSEKSGHHPTAVRRARRDRRRRSGEHRLDPGAARRLRQLVELERQLVSASPDGAGHGPAQRRPVRPRDGRQGRGQAQHHRPAAQLGQLRQDHQRFPEQVRHHRQQRRTQRHLGPGEPGHHRPSRASRARPTSSTSVRRLPPPARPAGLYTPYFVQTWATIPDSMKDPPGYWYGDYYGVISFGTNTNVQKIPPKDWSDLLNPRYHGQVAIDGDPRSANDAFSAVYAASLANGGSLDDIEPGINFFAKLKKIGNYIPADALPANIAKGSTPIAIIWDYLNLAQQADLRRQPALHGVDPQERRLRRLLLPGDQRHGPQPASRPPLAGVHLLRRGPAALPRGLHAPGALRRHGQAQRHSGLGDGRHAAGRAPTPASSSPRRTSSRPRPRSSPTQWGPKVAG